MGIWDNHLWPNRLLVLIILMLAITLGMQKASKPVIIKRPVAKWDARRVVFKLYKGCTKKTGATRFLKISSAHRRHGIGILRATAWERDPYAVLELIHFADEISDQRVRWIYMLRGETNNNAYTCFNENGVLTMKAYSQVDELCYFLKEHTHHYNRKRNHHSLQRLRSVIHRDWYVGFNPRTGLPRPAGEVRRRCSLLHQLHPHGTSRSRSTKRTTSTTASPPMTTTDLRTTTTVTTTTTHITTSMVTTHMSSPATVTNEMDELSHKFRDWLEKVIEETTLVAASRGQRPVVLKRSYLLVRFRHWIRRNLFSASYVSNSDRWRRFLNTFSQWSRRRSRSVYRTSYKHELMRQLRRQSARTITSMPIPKTTTKLISTLFARRTRPDPRRSSPRIQIKRPDR